MAQPSAPHILVKPRGDVRIALAEAARRNANPDSDGKAPFGHGDDLARVARHNESSHSVLNQGSHAALIVSSLLGHLPGSAKVEPMCGRARLSSDVSEIKLVFSIPPRAADAQLSAELECGADRPAAGRPLRCQGAASAAST